MTDYGQIIEAIQLIYEYSKENHVHWLFPYIQKVCEAASKELNGAEAILARELGSALSTTRPEQASQQAKIIALPSHRRRVVAAR